jgi:hypothetical protein
MIMLMSKRRMPESWTCSNLCEAMTSVPRPSLWVISGSWSHWDISPKSLHVSRGRRLFRSQSMTKPLCLKNFSLRGFGCRRIQP